MIDKKYLKFAILLLLGALPVQSISAEGYVDTRAGWSRMPLDAQAAYVQGLHDGLNYHFSDDSLENAIAKRGRTNCLKEQGITAAVLARTISQAYDLEQFQGLSPVAVYIIRIGEICRPYINSERRAFGLPAQ